MSPPAPASPFPASIRPARPWASRIVIVGGAAAFAALAAGFVLFVLAIDTAENQPRRHADGIVALTGGADRVADAIELLTRGHADRLLITGVNPSTNRDELARHRPGARAAVECCVDLGYRALNTVGNAQEAADWVRAHNIHSLIVVTSNYHMPRAMAEIAHALPDVDLQAYPVVSERARQLPWWADTQRARVLAWEYLKYLAVKVRLSVVPEERPSTRVARNAD